MTSLYKFTPGQQLEQDCTFELDGRKFESGGAIVTEQFIIAYLKEDGILADWHGVPIGAYRVLSQWRTPRSYSSTMSSCECFVNGVRYVGRSAGVGMVIIAKRSPRQSKAAR